MANIKFEIKGTDKLLKELKSCPGITNKWIKKAMHANVMQVRNLSQSYTPVDTGNLRASIRTKVDQKGMSKFLGLIWYIAEYAIYVHEKTWTRLRSGRHKFLELALFESTHKIKRTYVSSIKKAFLEEFK